MMKEDLRITLCIKDHQSRLKQEAEKKFIQGDENNRMSGKSEYFKEIQITAKKKSKDYDNQYKYIHLGNFLYV